MGPQGPRFLTPACYTDHMSAISLIVGPRIQIHRSNSLSSGTGITLRKESQIKDSSYKLALPTSKRRHCYPNSYFCLGKGCVKGQGVMRLGIPIVKDTGKKGIKLCLDPNRNYLLIKGVLFIIATLD